jgi:hypothetical protein
MTVAVAKEELDAGQPEKRKDPGGQVIRNAREVELAGDRFAGGTRTWG